jgi:hypothetical protein
LWLAGPDGGFLYSTAICNFTWATETRSEKASPPVIAGGQQKKSKGDADELYNGC